MITSKKTTNAKDKKKIKKQRYTKPDDFYAKKKSVYKKHDKQKSGKYFNCGKYGHFSKEFKQKQGKLKNKLNILKIDDSDKEDLIRILESRSSNSSDNDVLTSIDSNYHSNR